MRNPDNVLESLCSKACNSSYTYKRIYRNLYNKEFFLKAYQQIYAKQGNMTTGTDGKTVDGMSTKRIENLINKLKDFSYQPTPARRIHIPKQNGKTRPLSIPSFDDKLVQEIVRSLLESIYEPVFLDSSHGFRPKRSCHTALRHVQKSYTGIKWFIEGDIKGCFDNIDHHILIGIIRKRVKDEQFIALLWKFLKGGYMENWKYHNTFSGTPQGSIISPILANIYLHELDTYIEEYVAQFNTGKKRKINPDYKKPLDKCRAAKERYKRNKDKISNEEKESMLAKINCMTNELRSIPYGDPMDSDYKRLVYVRYADDFLLGVIGNKKDTEKIKANIGQFLKDKLKLELSAEKTLITHGADFAHFLSYDITTSTESNSTRTKRGYTKRSFTGRIKLYVPKEKWLNKLISYGALKITHMAHDKNKEKWEPIRRPSLLRNDDLEILQQYNAEIRGLYNYYCLAHNATVLNDFYYVMKYSMLKTFAGKYKTHISKVIKKYRHGKDFGVRYKTGKSSKVALFYNEGFKRKDTVSNGNPDIIVKSYQSMNNNSLIKRLLAQKCEWCGIENIPLEMHHVRKLKDLKGKKRWEVQMIGRKRKTLALCLPCHNKLHAGKLD